jgi:hypothetical protein
MKGSRTQRRRMLVCITAVAIGLGLVPRGAFAKKKDKNKARLQALENVFVEGDDFSARYVRDHLESETCLKSMRIRDEADAILEVWEETTPCRSSLRGLCLGIRAKLVDRKTNKTIWFRMDDEMGSRFEMMGSQTAGKWVLWQLRASCCKGR